VFVMPTGAVWVFDRPDDVDMFWPLQRGVCVPSWVNDVHCVRVSYWTVQHWRCPVVFVMPARAVWVFDRPDDVDMFWPLQRGVRVPKRVHVVDCLCLPSRAVQYRSSRRVHQLPCRALRGSYWSYCGYVLGSLRRWAVRFHRWAGLQPVLRTVPSRVRAHMSRTSTQSCKLGLPG
jgi:hypothetical protein